MKKLLVLISIMINIILLTLSSCTLNTQYLEKPEDTNLEFWITQNVIDFTFSDYFIYDESIYSFRFYGKGYEPFINDAGVWEDPKYCVKYLVSGYPNYKSIYKSITEIVITDPNITFYGISLNSSVDDFERILKDLRYKITVSDDFMYVATRGNIVISLSEKYLKIKATVVGY